MRSRWWFLNDPPLLLFFGVPPAVAVVTEANQIIASSFLGALAHLKRRKMDLKMSFVLSLGGVIGAGIAIIIFNYLKGLGQVDLLVKLCYVVFLGTIGAIMFLESIRALVHSKRATINLTQSVIITLYKTSQ